MPRAKRGFTLIEILVAMVVVVLIMGAITSVFYYLLVIPPQQTDQLNAENQLRLSLDWIQNDGVQAHSFTLNESPCSPSAYPDSVYYGYFSSYNTSKQNNLRYVSYRYEGEQLIREESVGCDSYPSKTTTIAFNIEGMGDVSFYCGEGVTLCDGRNPITVNMTVTLNPDSQNKVRKEISITDTRYIEMRADP
jgi:prepilin-type N-terminal cleavage/methylation domain-containing protein